MLSPCRMGASLLQLVPSSSTVYSRKDGMASQRSLQNCTRWPILWCQWGLTAKSRNQLTPLPKRLCWVLGAGSAGPWGGYAWLAPSCPSSKVASTWFDLFQGKRSIFSPLYAVFQGLADSPVHWMTFGAGNQSRTEITIFSGIYPKFLLSSIYSDESFLRNKLSIQAINTWDATVFASVKCWTSNLFPAWSLKQLPKPDIFTLVGKSY